MAAISRPLLFLNLDISAPIQKTLDVCNGPRKPAIDAAWAQWTIFKTCPCAQRLARSVQMECRASRFNVAARFLTKWCELECGLHLNHLSHRCVFKMIHVRINTIPPRNRPGIPFL